MGKEQRAMCSSGRVVEVEAAVLLKLGLDPSRVEEAYVGRVCETTAVWIGSTVGVQKRPEGGGGGGWGCGGGCCTLSASPTNPYTKLPNNGHVEAARYAG